MPSDSENIIIESNIDNISKFEYDIEYDEKITHNCKIIMDELINVVSFNCLFNNLSVQEITIINLKLGYINNHCYSTELICKFLNIPKEKVVLSVSKVLNICDNYSSRKLIDYNRIDNGKNIINNNNYSSYNDLCGESINDECKKYMNLLLNNISFNSLFNNLSIQEVSIIALKMGYVNSYCYSTELICDFLNISKEVVYTTLSKALNLCKKYQAQGLIDLDNGFCKKKK